MTIKTRKFSEFVPVTQVDEVVGLANGQNAIGQPSGGGGGAPASASYVVKDPDSALPNAVALNSMPAGVLVTDGTGELDSAAIIGMPGEIVVTGGSGALDPYIISIDPNGGGADSTSSVILDPTNTFTTLDWVRHDGTNYTLAQANTATNGEVIGVIVESTPGVSFRLKQSGYIRSLSALNPLASYLPLIPGRVYFLSQSNSGELDLIEPSADGTVSRPCLVADTADSGWIIPYRGLLNSSGGAPVPPPPGPNPNVITWTQTNASVIFSPGDLVTPFNNAGVGEFKLADNRNFDDSQVAGMVKDINVGGDPNVITIQVNGYADFLAGLTRATLYYLGQNGQMTTVRPSAPNEFVRPIFLSLDDDNGFILEQQSINAAAGSDAEVLLVNQANPFWVGAIVRNSTGASTYTLAQANSIANATTAGMVVWTDGNSFMLQQNGWINGITHWSNQPGDTIVAGQRYWLSSTNPGCMTPFEPTNPGDVSRLMYISNTTSFGQIQEQRPMLQPYANGGGGGGGGMALIYSFIANNTQFVDFINVFDPQYEYYMLMCSNITPVINNTTLRMIFGSGNPVVWDVGANAYRWTQALGSPFGVSGGETGGNFDSSIQLDKYAMGNQGNQEVNMVLYFFDPFNPNSTTHVSSTTSIHRMSSNVLDAQVRAMCNTSIGAVNSFRIYASNGNLATGKFKLFGIG